ncbi:hypothetical protein LUZ60_006574 [Juncus effusus]|nr:hypothetical protein LUZ60_006574 [Juncus effusus]
MRDLIINTLLNKVEKAYLGGSMGVVEAVETKRLLGISIVAHVEALKGEEAIQILFLSPHWLCFRKALSHTHTYNMFQGRKCIEGTRHPSSPDSSKRDTTLYRENAFHQVPMATHDPLCKLNLKETSEFVNSMPLKRSHSTNLHRTTYQEGKRDSPVTPGFRATFRSSPGNNFSSQRKSVSSKWEEAERWLVSSSSYKESPSSNLSRAVNQSEKLQILRKNGEFERNGGKFEDFGAQIVRSINSPVVKPLVRADVFLQDKFSSKAEQLIPTLTYSNPKNESIQFKKYVPAETNNVHTRDFGTGTELTPIGTPTENSSPVRHNTPASKSGLLVSPTIDYNFAKLKLYDKFDSLAPNWNSREEEEEEVSKSLRHFERSRKSFAESRACAWEEEERSKSCIRYQREEAKIQAWVNLENAKAKALSRKLEVKIQKMSSNLEDKLMKRMAIVHRKAEEWRTSAQLQHSQQLKKAYQHAQKLKNEKKLYLNGNTAPCTCFSCNINS